MPQRELERLQAVNRFLKLEFSKEKELQEIVELAAAICGTPTALITLIDEANNGFGARLELECRTRSLAIIAYEPGLA